MDFVLKYTFANPWLLLSIPVVWILFLISRYNTYRREHLPWTQQDLAMPRMRTVVSKCVDWIVPLALTCICLGLARPLKFFNEEKIKADGISIIMAMDVSASMLTQDFNPDRLTVAKDLASTFIDSRPYDRIGLVVFSGEAFTQCPLTTNHDILKTFISQLRPGIIEDGTAIGTGLATALNAIKDSVTKSKIIILLTDGENNAGSINPSIAAQMAASMDVKVYTIGMGSEGIAQAPVSIDENGNYLYAPRKLTLDPSLLIEIADISKGKFYRAQSAEALSDVYKDIDKLEKTEVEINVYRRQSEYFRFFIISGIMLLAFYYLLRFIYLKRYLQ